jgi:hypothetical protein
MTPPNAEQELALTETTSVLTGGGRFDKMAPCQPLMRRAHSNLEN